MNSKSPLRLAVFGFLAAASAHAQIISWNFDQFGTITAPAEAGIVSAGNWTNTIPPNGNPLNATVTDLQDNTGVPSTLDITYGAWGAWRIQASDPGADADGSNNKRLLNGYLNAGPAPWNPPVIQSSVLLSEIPFEFYDIVVYFSSDEAGREGKVMIGDTIYYFSTLGAASIADANATLLQTTSTDDFNYAAANYAVFSGFSGAAQSIVVEMRDNDEWAGIAGFQVIAAVPEPSTVTMLVGALGVLAVIGWQRHRRA